MSLIVFCSNINGMGLNVKGVDAKERFYNVLHGISDPEKTKSDWLNVY